MLSSTPNLSTIICFIFFSYFWQTYAQVARPPGHGNDNSTLQEVVCTPSGACQPCPEDILHEPFCQPFGNRRPMHCINITSFPPHPAIRPGIPPTHTDPADFPDDPLQSITPAWESCGRIVEQERADFWEFVGCNVLLAGISIFILFARSRRLQARQARQLAARIGLFRGGMSRSA